MGLTPWLDLRGGRDCWEDDPVNSPPSDALAGGPFDVAIIGAGIGGAVMAERLAETGRRVVVLDRRLPGTGSAAASTALVLWAPDTPLVELAELYGEVGARERWLAVFEAVQALDVRIRRLKLNCSWKARPDLYLAGDRLNAEGLQAERRLREAAGLPTRWISGARTWETFGVKAEAALVSERAFTTDPVAFTRALLSAAQTKGARLVYPAEVVRLDEQADEVRLCLKTGETVLARQVALTTGYEILPPMPKGFSLGSSFAIASPPDQPPGWRQDAMIWEASDPYLYLRTTPDGRIVVGGEDEQSAVPAARDALIPVKAETLARKAAARLGIPRFEIDRAWAATFASSDDGLPAIGPVRGYERVFAGYNFGGNGIAFAALAADLLVQRMAGERPPSEAWFALERFG